MSLSGSSGSGIVRSSSQLFRLLSPKKIIFRNHIIFISIAFIRDCLRLIHHIAGKNSPKAISLKRIVKAEFKKNAKQTDRQVINDLKSVLPFIHSCIYKKLILLLLVSLSYH